MNSMSKTFLGIDGGGTKTHACLVDLDGHVLATAANGSANWERIGTHATIENLGEVIGQVLETSGTAESDILESTFALAGVDWDADIEMFKSLLSRFEFENPAVIINDAFAALFAGTSTGIGIVSIAGTGGKTAGRTEQANFQTMGMELGEGGGAGQLVALTLDLMAKIFHGLEAPSRLTDMVLDHAGFSSLATFFKAVARDDFQLGEELAPNIFAIAKSADLGAMKIVKEIATQHAKDVKAVAGKLIFTDVSTPVIRAGGLHTAKYEIFDETFESVVMELMPEASLKVLDISPVYGSVIQAAKQHFGIIPTTFLNNLLMEARTGAHL